jgi:hypothetical protein
MWSPESSANCSCVRARSVRSRFTFAANASSGSMRRGCYPDTHLVYGLLAIRDLREPFMADDPKQVEAELDDAMIIWPRFVRSILMGSTLGKPGEPIEVDWEYITGRVNEPRSYGRERAAIRRGASAP